jgi:hypothetical protein
MKNKILIVCYGLASLLLFLYSYTQVDLSLTLSRASIWQIIQKWFQSIGYFNRPLSTAIYIGILFIFFVLYELVLSQIRKKKITAHVVWIIIGTITFLTCLSYPAFSYDFFNYLFTAKTVLIYHRNPYTVIPLQFSGVESWLSFMHWTHLPSAYTPLWISLTLIPYILGFGYFLLLLWSLKIVVAAAYVGTTIGIYKILEKVDKTRAILGVAIFALNPLVIIECLVSGHNDIVMMAIAIWSVVFYLNGKRWISWLMLSVSIAMKLMTIFLIPAFVKGWNRKIALGCILAGFLAVLSQREVLGWYWVWVVPFVALIPEMQSLTIISTGVSLGLLLRYAPFLYLGNWDAPAPIIKTWGTGIPVVLSLCVATGMYLFRKKRSSKQSV